MFNHCRVGVYAVYRLQDEMLKEIIKSGETRPLAEDSTVDVTVRNGKLLVTPILEPEFTLEELVRRITPKNRHSETDMRTSVGNEVC